MDKKNVIFVGSFAESGVSGNVGGQMYASKLLIESKLAKDVHWLLIDSTASSNIKVPFNEKIWNATSRMIKLLNYLVFYKTDAVLIFVGHGMSFLEKGLMALLAKLFGKKVILAPRSGFLKQNIKERRFLYRYIKFVFKKVDYIICQGKSWHQLFETQVGVSPSKLVIVPNWIDSSVYRINVGKGEPIIITFLAWVDRSKGIYETIKLGAYLQDRYNVQLNIAGNGKDYENIKQLIQDENLGKTITLKGWVTGEDKIDLLAASHIFILPSYAEGMPNALLEAMASGLACVATKVGSIPDVIQHGTNGLLVDPGDENGLIQQVVRLLDSPVERDKMGRLAREDIDRKHSIDAAVQIFKRLIIN